MNEIDLRTTELGHAFTYRDLRDRCQAVWGGVSWPGKRPGFAVVVGMGHKPHLDGHDIFLLDEFESFDTRQLVRQAATLDVKYCISLDRAYNPNCSNRWVGDSKNDAASRFIAEMNAEREQANRSRPARHTERFSLSGTMLLEMENLYSYVIPQIKDLVAEERRTLFLKDSKVKTYLSQVEEVEIAELQLGSYPAIEAISFAVIELRRTIAAKERAAHAPEGDVWPTGNPVDAYLKGK